MGGFHGGIVDDESYDPFDDRDDYDECECLEYEVDILTGEANCWQCGRHWILTTAELEREARFQAEQYEAYAEEMANEPSSGKQ